MMEGSCHCGRVRFEVDADIRTHEIVECNCSICQKKGFLHLIVEPDAFELMDGTEAIQIYQFHTETAVHKFCRYCGIHPFYVPRSHPDKIDVNVRCLDADEWSIGELETRKFDGKNWDQNRDELSDL